jgi:hypothetical protein
MAIAKMQQVLSAVLSQGNKEQNMAYAPRVFNDHFNLVTAFLLSEVAKQFPTSQSLIDIARSFLIKKTIPLKNGKVEFPADYRHFLSAAIFVTDDFTSNCDPVTNKPCDDDTCKYPNDPLAPTMVQEQRSQLKRQCISQAVRMVDIGMFDRLTRHKYKRPTLQKPIGCIMEGDGIKICPYDVPNVELRYLRQPKVYKYGYVMNPDDTYSFNPATTIESEWTDNAMQPLVTACTKLFSVYVRDGELKNYLLELSQAGIF